MEENIKKKKSKKKDSKKDVKVKEEKTTEGTVGADEKVNDVKKDDVVVGDDVAKVEDDEKVGDDEKVNDVKKDDVAVGDDVAKVEDDEKVDDVKVDDEKVEDDVKVEDDEKLDDVAKADDVEDDLKVKVNDLKVKVKDEESVGVDVKDLYNTPPKANFGRRVRKPKKDESYINPSLSKMPKTNDPMKINPLQKFEDELLDKVKDWLMIQKQMMRKGCIDLRSGEGYEMDAFCYLLRKRIAEYPKTYKKSKVGIGDCLLTDRIRREYKKFSKDIANYPVDEFKDYYMCAPHRNMPEWSEIDDIYLPVNINQKHWILCVARLQKYRIDVYDCDAYLYKNLDPFLKPLCEMIPQIFAHSITDGERKKYPDFNFRDPIKPMTYKRFPHPKVKTAVAKIGEVPRESESGDCGVFTLMYMEYLTANLGVQNVTSDNMGFFRQKMAVRLFHQVIEP
ncbi:bifunctional lysine-specific demethylase and histidyl-hydroxylase NO66-like [Impatiens glandulifera]|uniref:bifunctional lysine-specific demethylase and histidyl-hydroxylase NO66-like n=1 Tax=Impatiens glandulifera TaxID=253017 RepID=UPI001FB1276C|nr:bifunctional lysine-specific demethylase and histidyl-hydroxylase NO66-like [Impatiens glandulifera]